MTDIQPRRFLALAKEIYGKAIQLDAYLTAHSLPSPSFDDDFPTLSPELESTRVSILESTDELTDLMLGPRGLAESGPPQHSGLVGLQAIRRYGIPEKVDVDEEVEYSELARRCKLPVDDLRRLLRSAMARHVFKEPRKGYVAHNAASRIFLQSPLLNSFLYSALDEIWPAAAHMLDAMDKWKDSQEPHESGFNLAKNTSDSFFGSMPRNPHREEAFANTMKYVQSRPGMIYSPGALLNDFDWASSTIIVDVGGGTGSTCADIARKFPAVNCIVQDLVGVVTLGRETIASDVSSRIEFMEHDFFKEQPVKYADVYLLRAILHDWSDKHAKAIIRGLVPALKEGANIVLQEMVIPPPGLLSFYHEKTMSAIDLSMKALMNAKERSIEDWKELFASVDPHFHFVDAKMLPGSSLATIHIKWHKSNKDSENLGPVASNH